MPGLKLRDHGKIIINSNPAQWPVIIASDMVVTLSSRKSHILTFFLQNGIEANLTANNGVLNYETNNIEAFGNVIVTDGSYILKTEHIFYNNKNKIIASKDAVKILGTYFNISANSMILNIDKGSAELNGDINAVF